jgi:predicted transcriptional regulator
MRGFPAVVTLSDGRVTWSEADDGLLLSLKASGKTVAEIAEEMSRSHSAVASRLAHIRRRERIARRFEGSH